jgi:hypothetical protein
MVVSFIPLRQFGSGSQVPEQNQRRANPPDKLIHRLTNCPLVTLIRSVRRDLLAGAKK